MTLFKTEEEQSPDASPQEKAIAVFKKTLTFEFITSGVSVVIAFVFGYLYEAWSRKAVLITIFVLLALTMWLPGLEWQDNTELVLALTRVSSAVLV